MPCTTVLAGKNATYDGSTFMARNEDSGAGEFTAKKFIVVRPEDQPRKYVSVISGVAIDLPGDPMRYSAVPNALPDEGVWGEAGVNECNVSMSETETITSNARVLGADPLVKSGIGEEDMLTLVLPYIRSAREGVRRLGRLLEEYGTYEMNGIGFQDAGEVWWLESVGGHHWIARRVPDDCYAVVPNQLGIDRFDLTDAFGEQKDHMCSADLLDFIRKNHLDLAMNGAPLEEQTDFDARLAFGSRDDSDISYNTARAWDMQRKLNPSLTADPTFTPDSFRLAWALKPETKLTPEDVKYVLSLHYQGTPYDPYARYGDLSSRGKYRPIGVNRNNFMSLVQIRPDVPAEISAIQWIAMGSNVFNAFVPFYANTDSTHPYFSMTCASVTTENFYWANRIIGVMADAHFSRCALQIERYQHSVQARGRELLNRFDAEFAKAPRADAPAFNAESNRAIGDMAKEETQKALGRILYEASTEMKNGYSRSDA